MLAILLYCQFCLRLCHAVGSFVLDIGDHLHSSSDDVSDNDEIDIQDNDVLLVIITNVLVLIYNSCKQWARELCNIWCSEGGPATELNSSLRPLGATRLGFSLPILVFILNHL